MDKYGIQEQIKLLQNAKTAREISERADYFTLIIKENKVLKERLNVQELTVNEFIEELAWRDVQWAAEASGMSSEACGQPSRGAISTYRKSYDKFYEECKQFAEARLKELKGGME